MTAKPWCAPGHVLVYNYDWPKGWVPVSDCTGYGGWVNRETGEFVRGETLGPRVTSVECETCGRVWRYIDAPRKPYWCDPLPWDQLTLGLDDEAC